MKTGAEVGVTQPQAKEPREPPGVGRARKDSVLESSEGPQLCRDLNFGLLTSRTVREYLSVVSCSVYGNVLQQS